MCERMIEEKKMSGKDPQQRCWNHMKTDTNWKSFFRMTDGWSLTNGFYRSQSNSRIFHRKFIICILSKVFVRAFLTQIVVINAMRLIEIKMIFLLFISAQDKMHWIESDTCKIARKRRTKDTPWIRPHFKRSWFLL